VIKHSVATLAFILKIEVTNTETSEINMKIDIIEYKHEPKTVRTQIEKRRMGGLHTTSETMIWCS
jgi:hypothetical protein